MKKILFSILFFFISIFCFADGFVVTKIFTNDSNDESIVNAFLINKDFSSIEKDGKIFHPVQVKYLITEIQTGKIYEQITYSDVNAPLSIKYYFSNDNWDN